MLAEARAGGEPSRLWAALLVVACGLAWGLLLCAPLWGLWVAVPGAAGMLWASVLLHECAHGTLWRSRTSNVLWGLVFGVMTLSPFFGYRRGHRAHHRWSGDGEGRDPTASPQRPRQPSAWLDVALWLQLPVLYWGGVWGPYLLYDLRPSRGPRRAGHVAGWAAEISAMLLVYGALGWALGGWFLGALALAFWGAGVLYERLFTMSHHLGLRAPPGDDPSRPPTTRAQVNHARSIQLSGAALLCYFTLHKEHHLAPGLRFEHLPALHDALRRRRPDLYAFTTDDLGLWRRRRGRAHELLTPRDGDAR